MGTVLNIAWIPAHHNLSWGRGKAVDWRVGELPGAASANYGNRIVFLIYEALYNFGANID